MCAIFRGALGGRPGGSAELRWSYHPRPFWSARFGVEGSWEWTGGRATLVFLGDYLDSKRLYTRFDNMLDAEVYIIDTIFSLQQKAATNGGRVVAIIGNHELMNLGGADNLFDYADASHRSRPDMFHHTTYWGNLLMNHTVAMAVIDGILYVHGGLGSLTTDGAKSLGDTPSKRVHAVNSHHATCMKEHDFSPDSHPFQWARNVGKDLTEFGGCHDSLGEVLDLFGATKMVVGHTPQTKGISSSCDGRAIRADTGASRAFAVQSKVEILAFFDHQLTPWARDVRTKTWRIVP